MVRPVVKLLDLKEFDERPFVSHLEANLRASIEFATMATLGED